MIVSASRRTDIPALFSEWFYNRVRKGFVLLRNPYNPLQVGRVSLAPDRVDGIVFWTKNAAPMADRLHELGDFQYSFQYTMIWPSKYWLPGIRGKYSGCRTVALESR